MRIGIAFEYIRLRCATSGPCSDFRVMAASDNPGFQNVGTNQDHDYEMQQDRQLETPSPSNIDNIVLSTPQSSNKGFPYPKLDSSTKQIRLLMFMHKRADGNLVFSLESCVLEQTSFIALSYTWDRYEETDLDDEDDIICYKEEQSQCIIVNGNDFWITQSLHRFLEVVAPKRLGGHFFFVDQICISQDDRKEKEHQVSIMGDIYSGADEVIAWIVPLRGPANHAAHILANRMDLQRFLELPEDKFAQNRSELKRDAEAIATEFLRNFVSAYWSRQWIVQEMILAKELTLQIAQFSFDWKVVFNLVVGHCDSGNMHWEAIANIRLSPVMLPDPP